MITVHAPDAISARAEAEAKAGGPVHISSVFYVSNDPSLRAWVFTTILSQ